MAILIDQTTKFIVQGITGKEGQRAAAFMKLSGSNIIGGVRPGKAGEVVDGVPVFDTVKDVLGAGSIAPVSPSSIHRLCSVIIVPPHAVKAAAVEAIDAGVDLVVPIAEGVPVHDSAWLYAYAKERGVRILGPNTVGVISVGQSKAGVIGGEDNRAFSAGNVGIISKSGGMTGETARLLTRAGIGQSTCVNIGGDRVAGTDFVDCLKLFAADEATRAVVLFGEVGGTYEEQAAEWIKSTGFKKPVVAFVSGIFAERFRGIPLGHAGAVIEGNQGTRESKVTALRAAGVTVVDIHHDLVAEVKSLLEKK
jgi:succinyl-CoA synthetase alpha subunit